MNRQTALEYVQLIRSLLPDATVSSGGSEPRCNVWVSPQGHHGDPIFLRSIAECQNFVWKLHGR